ncbi:MAG: hypothetical protein OEY20_11065 [Gemmatimonadota bacterium]|nr:hypothetical protein [Gemmatimonadota bacterium]MDH4350583.1 hypothetical protein [Gemmatimonadota bacterium]MDH5197783.1 hypothetical protein [Gemmatimonadota bacterium]
MNGAEQTALAIRLDAALAAAGLQVLRGVKRAGNLVGWESVPAAAVVGALLQAGWRVEEVPAQASRVLTLEPGS